MPAPPTKQGRYWPVHDRDALRRVGDYLATLPDRGGLDRKTVRRMRQGQVRAMREGTVDLLTHRLEGEWFDVFMSALTTPDENTLYIIYARWCDERAGRFIRRPGVRYAVRDGTLQPVVGPEAEAEREAALTRLYDRLRRGACREILAPFEQVLKRGGLDARRCQVARWRIVEPLLESAESGFVERDWREMSTEELRRFIRAGITRELLLLNRPHADARIREMLRGSGTRRDLP